MRTLLTCLLLATSCSLLAQIQRGDRLLRLEYDNSVVSDNLATLYHQSSGDYTELAVYPTYGIALTNRLVVGGQLYASLYRFSGEGFADIGLSPFVRYYPVNRARLGVFIEASTGVALSGGELFAGEALRLTAGLQLPLAPGLRIGPDLSYHLQEGWNTVSLGTRMELVLGRNTRSESTPVATFGKGSLMVGGQQASFNLRRDAKIVFGGFSLSAHYFLSNRLAAIGGLAFSATYGNLGTSQNDFIISGVSPSVTTGARYYLSSGRRLVWFMESRATYAANFDTSPDRNGRDSYRYSVQLAGGGGGQYWIRDRIALEFGPEFRRVIESYDELSTSLISLNGGVRFLLR